MDLVTAMGIGKSTLEVLVAALTVLGILWRAVDSMINRKVREQVTVAMEKLTKTTSGELSELKKEVTKNHERQMERTDERFDQLTQRIDQLLRG